MRIVLTGAGGGHFYPLIAVAQKLKKESFAQNIAPPEIFFVSDKPYDEKELFKLGIKFIEIPAGKLRVYPSLENIKDFFKTFYGCLLAIIKLYSLYPDVVFAKGGYASFPTLFAARILSIPVVIHESDTVPGRVTKWAGRFADRVAISYKEAFPFYKKENTALTGLPIREEIIPPDNYKKSFEKEGRKVILVLGGSQGSQRLNDAVLNILPEIIKKYDVIHQVGALNVEEIKKVSTSILKDSEWKDHYYCEGFIDVSLFLNKIDLCITRAGSSMFEMALWKIPMIAIPIPETISRDQRTNAYSMASTGVATVLEENNIGGSILMNEIDKILENKDRFEKMSESGGEFSISLTASSVIARELIRIGLSHTN